MEVEVQQVKKRVRRNGMSKHNSGTGLKEQLGTMSNGRDANKRSYKEGQ